MATNPRKLHLKIRVVTLRPMRAETVRLLLARAIDTGHVPPGIEIRGIDWSRGVQQGTYQGTFRRVLRDFTAALVHAGTSTRFALVDWGDRPPRVAPARRPKRKGPFRDKQRRYRDAKGRWITKSAYDAARQRFTQEEESILDDMRKRLRTADVGTGAEFELTATTKGGTPLG